MAASDRRGVSGEVEICSKSVTVEQKRIFFNLKQNARGRFLKIAEVSRSGNRSTIIVPESGWMTFRDMLNSFITGEATEGISMPELPEPVAGAAGAGGAGAMPSESSGLQLWVENLPWDLSEEDLTAYFTPVGPVKNCIVQRRADGKSRGTAVVRYTSAEDATRAIESLDSSDIGGRSIRVRLDRRG